jgi:hypothetical protein
MATASRMNPRHAITTTATVLARRMISSHSAAQHALSEAEEACAQRDRVLAPLQSATDYPDDP